MNEQRNQGIVFVKDPTAEDGSLIKLESVGELEAFLKSEALATVNLSQLLWDSLQESFRIGKRVGRKHAIEEANSGNPYERR